MLVKLLSEEDKAHFFQLAELLSISDKPLLWDGKAKDEVTSRTDMKKVSFAKGEAESKLLSDWSREVSGDKDMRATGYKQKLADILRGEASPTAVEKLLLDQLAGVPLHKNTEDSVERLNAVSAILHRLLEGTSATTPHAVRIVLYELMLMALAAGGISTIEYRFLEILKQHHRVDDRDFAEILERAESMYREVLKTIALVLE